MHENFTLIPRLAITLTFKKDCTEHRARKTMRRLWNGIERQLYHKAFKKQGKRVERVCAFEKGQSGTHLHYHIATSKHTGSNNKAGT